MTVTPVVVASSSAIDTKPVRLRGYLKKVDNSASSYSAGVEPADGLVTEGGSIGVAPTTSTAYEVNGIASTSSTTGFSALSALSPGAWTIAYGSLSSSTTTQTSTGTNSGGLLGAGTAGTTTTTSTLITNLSFTPTLVLAGSSVQGGGYDVVSGVVTARNGNVLTVPTASWISKTGVPTFLAGTATITLGTSTAVLPGPGATLLSNTEAAISVGSVITAYGTSTSAGGGNLSLDATSGRVRISDSVVAGNINPAATTLDQVALQLDSINGRQVGAFDFSNTGIDPAQYTAEAAGLDLSNEASNAPIQLTGQVEAFGTTTYAFLERSAADISAINAELVLDWGSAGVVAPFTVISSAELDLQYAGGSAGPRHQITVGPDVYPLTTLTSTVVIIPSSASTLVYSIAHAATATVENFNSFAAFAKALQAELNGTTVATSMTAEGIYTPNGTTFSATGIIVSLNL